MRISGTLFAIIALLAGHATFAVDVGNPEKPADLPRALAETYSGGAREIVIRPGTYLLPGTGKDTLLFERWQDARISAAGVTLIFEELNHRPVRFDRCSNVTFKGAVLRFVSHACSQGRITAAGADRDGPYCDWQIDAGYPSELARLGKTLNLVDQKTRLIKAGTSDIGYKAIAPLGPGLYRLHFARGLPAHLAVGDWFVTRYAGGSTLLHLDTSRNVTVQDVVCQNGGFGTFFETGGGSNHLIGCKVTFGPKPPGATEAPLVSCGADGFHSVGTDVGPEVRDCVFEGVFLDDCIAIHGTFRSVAEVSGRIVTLEGEHDGGFAAGEPVRFSDKAGFFAQANCTAVQRVDGPAHRLKVTLDQDLPIPVGAKGNNPNRCGRGFKIINTRLGNTRSRGILVKADDGLIDGCTIEGCVMSGLSVGPEYYWNEANYVWNLVVSNNTFRDCNKHGTDHAVLLVHGDGAIGNRSIAIINNRFESGPCRSVLSLEWADGIDLRLNTFINAPQPRDAKPAMIRLAHTRSVKLFGNVVTNLGPYPGDLVEEGPDVLGTVNNNGVGIKAVAAP